MTTLKPQTRSAPATDPTVRVPSDFQGYVLIPLSEFGLSLESPGLDTWFEDFAGRNKDAVGEFEITAQGELKIMPPTGIPGAWFELEMASAVLVWSHGYGGIAGGPTIRFVMPDGALLGPDACWISEERWNALPAEARTPPFASVVPDFVAEIVSPSNRAAELAGKVRAYLEGGARLVWVIHPRNRTVAIYRPGIEPENLENPETLNGGDVLPGFAFNVRERIFDNVP